MAYIVSGNDADVFTRSPSGVVTRLYIVTETDVGAADGFSITLGSTPDWSLVDYTWEASAVIQPELGRYDGWTSEGAGHLYLTDPADAAAARRETAINRLTLVDDSGEGDPVFGVLHVRSNPSAPPVASVKHFFTFVSGVTWGA